MSQFNYLLFSLFYCEYTIGFYLYFTQCPKFLKLGLYTNVTLMFLQ